ncbi:RluA family pseudouridine synthase [Intestinimonas butyriciproducens]|uniref:RluA family pseudouridine synthase n=1 Tax=Intestinimonas butyriciproducens TaxID=1297617 RepID=UPI001959C79C|nr:RluA family pseudouridine synthase [Intestinimonas butyriciproducens]MBM6976739.1 RluA family pseudouridine synthase [Intestinimonas butyriciproducens]
MDDRRLLTVEEETTLLPFLLLRVRDKSRNTVKGLLSRRQVLVDGEVVTRFDAPLAPGQRVELLPKDSAGAAELPFPILYEDTGLIAVDKPAGLLSMGNERERRRTAYRAVSDYVKAREPGRRIFIVHRLDRDTSGVLVFAKDEKLKRALQDNWENVVKKRGYLAAVEGTLPQREGMVRSYLHETATHLVYSGPRGRQAKEAVTRYRMVAENRGYTLAAVEIDTGRKNQIRVHMQDLGCPIAGDRQYGAQTDPMGRLALHADVLVLTDPRTRRALTLRAPLPITFRRLFPGAAL